MNPLLYKDIHFQSVKYIMNWTVHGHKCLSSFLFFRFPSNWEREREWYIKFGMRRNSPKVTYLIFRRGSTGESFFFHGLIDFMLFLNTGLKNLGPSCPRYVFVFFTRSNGYGSVFREPLPITDFSSHFFRRRGEGATSVLGSQPIICILPPSPWCPATWGY